MAARTKPHGSWLVSTAFGCCVIPPTGATGRRSGPAFARLEWVFFTDADLQFDLLDLEPLLEASRGVDIVAGYRSPRRDPFGRRLLGWAWGRLVQLVFGLHIRDIDCAFKLFRREAAHTLFAESRIDGFLFDLEILMLAKRRDLAIVEVPVEWHNDPDSRVRVLRGLPSIAWQLLRILLRFLRIR